MSLIKPSTNLNIGKNIIEIFNHFQSVLFVLTIFIGLLKFYLNKEDIAQDIENEDLIETDKLIEQKKITEFSVKFPKINKIPLLKNVIKWVYKEGIWYIIGLITIIISGIALRLNNIKKLSIWYDEGLSISVAQNIVNGLGHVLINGDAYNRAFLYHSYLSFFYQFNDEFWVGIIANIPFYILTSIFLYLFGKELLNKKAGLLAIFLFAFSWVGIAMAREIRFYEMFICLFLIGNFFLFKGLKNFFHITLFMQNKKKYCKQLILIFTYFLISAIIFFISFKTQDLTFFILYALLFFGLILYLKSKKIGTLITTISLTLLLLGHLISHQEIWLKYTMPSWFGEIYNQANYLHFLIELFFNHYFYLIIILAILFYSVIKKSKINEIYLFSMLIGLYSIISFQGVGYFALLRYYYFIFPFIFIATAYIVISFYNKKNKIFKVFLSILLITIIGISLFSGLKEAYSPLTLTSKYEQKNLPYHEIFQILKSPEFKDYKTISDHSFAFVNYLENDLKINYLLDRRDILKTSLRERNTKIIGITYKNFINYINKGKKLIFVYDERNYKLIKYHLDKINMDNTIFVKTINSDNDKISIVIFN
ncbi:MAG: glycosyltransferase family 39 protein [Patescibacteria group bacterium]